MKGLCRLLRHRDVRVRRGAAKNLGELGEPDGVCCLQRALERDTDDYVRHWSIDALANISTPEAVDVLAGVMFGPQPQAARIAENALAGMNSPSAQHVMIVKSVLQKNDWAALEALSREQATSLAIVISSLQYRAWPSAKQQRILGAAIRLGVTPPPEYRKELADMGYFISGLHTVDDALRRLNHSKPDVRCAAAERLGGSGYGWLRYLLYRRFRKELARGTDLRFAAALVSSIEKLGSQRAIEDCKELLNTRSGREAADAAAILAQVGSLNAVEILFGFVVNPPPPPAYQNPDHVFNLLVQHSPNTIDILRPHLGDESVEVRRVVANLIGASNHPDRVFLLGVLGKDPDRAIQHNALRALARDNSPEAANRLDEIGGEVADCELLLDSLASMTTPDAITYLKDRDPGATLLFGAVILGHEQPVQGASARLLMNAYILEKKRWEWHPVGPEAISDSAGNFALALRNPPDDARLCLKIVLPAVSAGKDATAYTTEVNLRPGEVHHITAQVDTVVNYLSVRERS